MYGSIYNRLMDATNVEPPKVGDGATILMWSDRRAATIVEVVLFKSGAKKGQPRTIVVQEDEATALHTVMTDAQHWETTPNPDGAKREFHAKEDGTFKGLLVGQRRHYYDYSF